MKTSFLAQSRKKIEIAPEFYDKVGAILLLSYQQKNHNVLDIKQKSVFLRKILNIIKMKRPLLPKQERMLRGMGDNLRLARLRRDLSSEQVAERAGISRNTLIKIEKGDEGVAIGMYFRVLIVLGLQDDLSLIARDDVLGRKLQDIGLTTPRRATKRPPLNN